MGSKKLIGLVYAGQIKSTRYTAGLKMLNPWKDLKNGDFVRLYHPIDGIFTVGIYKGFTESGKKLLIEETRLINKEGKVLLFKRIQYWNSIELKGLIARIDV